MTRKTSVKQLVKPLCKLSLLPHCHTFEPDLDFIPEKKQQKVILKEIGQTDIVSLLPREVVLKIFSLLSFQDLIRVQLTCRMWRRLALDASIWRKRFYELNSRFTDIYAHKPNTWIESSSLPWKTRYCQAITFANWRMGTVQKLNKLDDNEGSRILSVKLRDQLLVTLSEDNVVKLYQYTTDTGFMFKSKWCFGDPITQPNCMIECVDVLPDIHILVVAQRGSKCMFYDINKGSKHDPIQVLKGGSHPWFIPDSISVNQDYFAMAGRKPSAVFVWNWRKGVRLSSRAFDNQPHNVFLSGDNLITVSVDGLVHVFDIFDNIKDARVTHYLNACSIPCIDYDNSLSIVFAPHASRRIHHYKWNEQVDETVAVTDQEEQPSSSDEEQDTTPVTPLRRRFSTTFINLFKSSAAIPKRQDSYKLPRPASSSSTTLSSREFYKSVRLRRHSSYNDYGYACQMRTDQYIREHKSLHHQQVPLPIPSFQDRPRLVHSIRTTPLGSTAKEIVNVAMHGERIATVNRHGDIALYALNGTTAARVTIPLHDKHEWMESEDEDNRRDDDELSDGYDSMRSRLAMGPMGLVYGSKDGRLWWLDFGCRALPNTK
ncbi:hypothetical protein CU098_002670 [Rhizopus stolonifer]|uniref:F-box domain-containing protein n=1 Tax=Rhizopus stolonifer TaxID=4846 RepID=A0A367KNN1_RHIST|nr:hypothetical protein CU098_002670 [Rhizopus stolonifer]